MAWVEGPQGVKRISHVCTKWAGVLVVDRVTGWRQHLASSIQSAAGRAEGEKSQKRNSLKPSGEPKGIREAALPHNKEINRQTLFSGRRVLSGQVERL